MLTLIGKIKCQTCEKEFREIWLEDHQATHMPIENLAGVIGRTLEDSLEAIQSKVRIHNTRCETVLTFYPEKSDATDRRIYYESGSR